MVAHNGFTIKIDSPDSEFKFFCGDLFRLWSLEEMVNESRSRLDDFFASVREVEGNDELFSHARALELCDIVDFADDAELCLIDFSLSKDRCVVVDTDYEDEYFPSGLRVISDSLFGFVVRCINARASLADGTGFRYFWPPTIEGILARDEANRDLPRRR